MPDGQRLPGAARRVVPLELVDERLGEAAAPLGLELAQAPLIAVERRVGRRRRLVEDAPARPRAARRRRARRRTAALAPVAHEARVAQAAEVRRHPRLRDARDAHEIGHAQLALAQQRAQPQAALVAEQVQRVDVAGRGSSSISRWADVPNLRLRGRCQAHASRAPPRVAAEVSERPRLRGSPRRMARRALEEYFCTPEGTRTPDNGLEGRRPDPASYSGADERRTLSRGPLVGQRRRLPSRAAAAAPRLALASPSPHLTRGRARATTPRDGCLRGSATPCSRSSGRQRGDLLHRRRRGPPRRRGRRAPKASAPR